MRHKGDLPAFSQHVVEINKKLSSLHSINFSSAGELSNVILKDMSLTNKLLKVVNSSYYGNVSGKVTTISRAVFLLGAEKVRLAAASLMILEHMQGKSQTDELKDAALSSFLSGVIARNVAEKMMYGAKEEVFICALLHNLGKHLVICYFPEEYQEIKNLMASKGADEQTASKMILGVSYSELGVGITKSWGFPESITDSMEVIRDATDKASESEFGILKSISNYANELCATVSEEDPSKRDELLKAISVKYQLTVSFAPQISMNFINDAATNVGQYADILQIKPSGSPLLRRFEAYHQEQNKRLPSAAELAPSSGEERADETQPQAPEEQRAEILKNCMSEINETLNSANTISDAIYMIIETMYRGFEFNRVLFCMLDSNQTKMSARFGFGENIDTILENFSFKITRTSDYFNIAVMRLRDIVVDDSRLPGVKENLPGWYMKMINARSFLIYPLMIKDRCIGLLYADKKAVKILNNDDERDYMNILRGKAVWAIIHKH